MSKEIALANINLEPAERWAHTEYSLGYHREYLSQRLELPEDDPQLIAKAHDSLLIDFNWNSQDGLINWGETGRVTGMGHASYAVDESDLRNWPDCPFKTPEEVWAFDAVAEYGLPNFAEQVAAYEKFLQDQRAYHQEQLISGGYYKTMVSGAIEAFGWEMLLLSLAEPAKMEKVFDSFFQRTHFFVKAWAATSIDVFIQHDDFVWTAGAFMNPEIYRQVIIPRYAELWQTMHAAGKKVLFCSDGNFLEFAPDAAEAGADGFIFEPCNDFGRMVADFGQSKCLVGSYVDCRDLAHGKWQKVKDDIDHTLEALQSCKGAIFTVGNHLAPNIPAEMMDKYFAYLLPKLAR